LAAWSGDDWSAVLGSVVEVGHGLLIREGCLIAGVLHVGDGLLIGLNGGLLCGLSSLLAWAAASWPGRRLRKRGRKQQEGSSHGYVSLHMKRSSSKSVTGVCRRGLGWRKLGGAGGSAYSQDWLFTGAERRAVFNAEGAEQVEKYEGADLEIGVPGRISLGRRCEGFHFAVEVGAFEAMAAAVWVMFQRFSWSFRKINSRS